MKKYVWPVLLILSVALAGVYLRFYQRMLPSLDLVARSEIYNSEINAIKKSVEAKYPDSTISTDLSLVESLFKDRLKNSKLVIEKKIAKRTDELKDRYRDQKGRLYLSGIDSYYWLRLLNNLIEKGHIGDRRVNGVDYDDMIGNPIDLATSKNVHIWLGLIFYKAAQFFNSSVNLEEVLFYIPVVLSVLIVIFSFITAKMLGAGDLGAFVASFAINLSPFFISRSTSEWFDTDIYNVLFPLLAFWAFLFAFQNRKFLARVFYCFVSALFLSFYASTWKGWWFIFDIMIISGLLFVSNQRMSKSESGVYAPVKPQIVLLGIFFLLTAVMVSLLNSFSVWKDFISEPLRMVSVLKVTQTSMWPNVYQTVEELGKAGPYTIVTALGPVFVFFFAMIGILYIFLVERIIRDERYGFGILCLVFWIITIFYASLEALRFMLLLIVPVGLVFGITVDRCYRFICGLSGSRINKIFVVCIRYVFVLAISFYAISGFMRLHSAVTGYLPLMDDTWHRALIKIKNTTPKDAFINSWWDYGHWFKTVACRRVLFDGMTQNTPYAYWIASALMSSDENESTAILRMINTSANKATEILETKEGLGSADAVHFIRTALRIGESSAREYLEKEARISPVYLDEILAALFPKRMPPVYFVVSYDMISKIGPISYIGNWDWDKVELWFNKKTLSKKDFFEYLIKHRGYSQDEAYTKYVWMSMAKENALNKWFSQPSGVFSGLDSGRKDDKIIAFENGLVVNLENNHAFVSSDNPAKRGVIKSLVFMDKGEEKVVSQKDSTLKFSALMVQKGDNYKSVLMDENVACSMLARLYFLKGEGLKHFKLVGEEQDDKGNAIYIYEMIW